MSKLHEISQLGQAIWLDDIRRSYLTSGELAKMVEMGLRGMTSNPTIFQKAITGSNDYDVEMRALVRAGKTTSEIYEALAIDDIRGATDTLRPVYEGTGGADGYVSLEVSPELAHNTAETIAEASRLFAAVDRPNLMIKIPATPQGMPAIQEAIARGVNVNITLIFSIEQYELVTQAFMAGLEQRAAAGGDLSSIASVASFFVSRVDTMVDKALQGMIAGGTEQQAERARSLLGQIAVANAKLAYARFQEIFSSPRWKKLEAQGARLQRPLWASTSTKNPAYSDTLYVDNLIGPHTVNTLPPAALQAFIDHGVVACTIDLNLDQARAQLAELAELGIDLAEVTRKLQDDGVAAFAASWEGLMASIDEKRQQMLTDYQAFLQTVLQPYQANLGRNKDAVRLALAEMDGQRVIERIWAGDYTVWKPEPTEITNRLGWLRIAEVMQKEIPRMHALVEATRSAGYRQALLLGMGGSSLAPEVMCKSFGVREGYLELAVLDSTDPGAVLAWAERLDFARTLFIVSTKSGGTVETFSFFKYFYNRVADALGAEQAGQHFVAITDPGSGLAKVAEQYRFRATFLNDPNIGGRYSALSFFGLLPAALTGLDVGRLLERAQDMAAACNSSAAANPGAWLGTALGELAKAGRDKVTLILSPQISSFGDWVEQLIAESTGKEGRGILPVVGEAVGDPQVYGADRFFIYLRLANDYTHDAAVRALESAGQPVVHLELRDAYDLGAQFFLWEMATAVAGYRLGIQPFNQPNVEAAKALAREMVADYRASGKLPELTPALKSGGISMYGDLRVITLEEAWSAFLGQAQPGAYVALQAYIQPTEDTDAWLLALRTRLRERTHLAVTAGYGPHFLHSTGQLHKGDAGKGLFVQITAQAPIDAPIPDEAGKGASSMTFEVLKFSQALGDRQALLDAGRKVIRFDLGQDVLVNLARLIKAVK